MAKKSISSLIEISNELPKPKKEGFDAKAFIESAKKASRVFEEEEKEQYERKISSGIVFEP